MAKNSSIAAAAIFTGAGVAHFARPDFFEAIVPDWFPDSNLANKASGAAEFLLGLGMLSSRTRKLSAFGLFVLAIVVFPANIDSAVNNVEPKLVDGKFVRSVGTGNQVANYVRLPFQLPLLWWLWREFRSS